MKKDKEISILDEHIHIDNGGYTFKYKAINNGDDEYYGSGLKISTSFFGYQEDTMKLCLLDAGHLKKLGMLFITAAGKLEELNEK